MWDVSTGAGFLAAAGATPLLCTIGGEQVSVGTAADADRVDRVARAVRRPAGLAPAGRDFPQPVPEPGGRFREYWVAARTVTWAAAPTGRDGWMNEPVPRTRFRALVYQLWSAGFAASRPALRACPGPPSTPRLVTSSKSTSGTSTGAYASRSRCTRTASATRPDYDGAYLGRQTRVGGFIAPGEEFTYFWEARPDSVGVWPYHDHGPNHTLNTLRGLFGAIVVRPRGAAAPDVEQVLMLHSLPLR